MVPFFHNKVNYKKQMDCCFINENVDICRNADEGKTFGLGILYTI